MSNVVLLFSPGLDSFLGNWYASKAIGEHEKLTRMYIDINSRYSEYEIEFLKKWYTKDEVMIVPGPDMSKLETPSAYIPNRNAILASLAQAITSADYVMLNATYDDRVSDGSMLFREHLSNALSVSSQKTIVVDSWLKHREKAEHVAEFANAYPERKLELLTKTFSCYSEDLYEEDNLEYFQKTEHGYEEIGKTTVYGCLECPACYRRMCALVSANLYVPFFNHSLVEEYTTKGIDSDVYPFRAKTMDNYYHFMKWFGSGD